MKKAINSAALLGVKPTATSGKSKTPHPEIVISNPLMVDKMANNLDELEVLEGAVKADRADIIAEVTPKWLALNKASATPQRTVKIPGSERSLTMTFTSRFSGVDVGDPKVEQIKAAVGEKKFDEFFRQKISITLDADKIEEKKKEAFLADLGKLLAKYDTPEAVKVKDVIVPIDGFNDIRAKKLTNAQNVELEEVMGMTVQIKRAAPEEL